MGEPVRLARGGETSRGAPIMTDLRSLLDAIQDEPDRALDLLRASPSLAVEKWSGGKPFIDGSTALHWAAHEDRVDLVHALLDAGADVDVASDDWWVTAVTWAADYGAHGCGACAV